MSPVPFASFVRLQQRPYGALARVGEFSRGYWARRTFAGAGGFSFR